MSHSILLVFSANAFDLQYREDVLEKITMYVLTFLQMEILIKRNNATQ